MKRIIRWGLIVCGVALVVIQFIRLPKTNGPVTPADFIEQYHPPADVQAMLRAGCYDCHSNQTRYPWYAEIQPVSWWLNDHIADAKAQLNFSEFGTYRIRRKYRKLEEMMTQVERGEMPISAYRFMHTDAEFTPAQKERYMKWVGAMRDSIKATTPPDSLARPKSGT